MVEVEVVVAMQLHYHCSMKAHMMEHKLQHRKHHMDLHFSCEYLNKRKRHDNILSIHTLFTQDKFLL